MMGRRSLEHSVRLLRDYYGKPEKPSVTDPLELILWENVALELTRKNGDFKGGASFECNGAACLKATGLTYSNVEWVNACATLPRRV